MTKKRLPPLHPGEVLREEFLKPMGLSAGAVAKACNVPRTRIERIASEQTPITADTALRLAKFFGTSEGFWMSLQSQHDLDAAKESLGSDLAKIETRRAA